jgi:PleD family two-component response regulator
MTIDDISDRLKHPNQEEVNIPEITSSEFPLILVVDDDLFMRKILVRYLTRENYRVNLRVKGPFKLRRICSNSFEFRFFKFKNAKFEFEIVDQSRSNSTKI